MPYQFPDSSCQTTFEVKKSQFIGHAAYAPDRDSAMAFLAHLRQQYPDARHHCWAYLLGNPEQPTSVAMGDDGEPSGTAGKPILNVLQHNPVGDVMLVVVRYFGGIKLGAGGLVRAYSASAQQTLDAVPRKQLVRQTALAVTTDFKHEQFIRHFVQQHEGQVDEVHYHQEVVMHISLPDAAVAELQAVSGNVGFTVAKQPT